MPSRDRSDRCPLLLEQTAGHKGLLGLDRLQCLHVNDAAAPLGSCRDRHANLGQGEMGKQGLAAFLSEPRFEGLPATLETPGPAKKGADRKEVQAAKRLRKTGLRRRQG